jgi:hypothetical protein
VAHARVTAAVLAALVVLARGADAASGRAPCPGGRFVSHVGDVFGDGQLISDRYFDVTPCSATHAVVTVPSCGTLRAHLSAHARATRLTTGWTRCRAFGGRVKLSGKMYFPACTTFRGTLFQRSIGGPVKIVNAGLSRCGDGVVDAGEECDGGPGCDGSCQLDAGSTGAFGIVTANGTRKLYLPLKNPNKAGHGVIAVVDAGVPGAAGTASAALLKDIDLGTADVATATAGNGEVVIATSTTSLLVWFIDPRTDEVQGTVTLPAELGQSKFSGADHVVVSAVAIDSSGNRAMLAVNRGIAFLDLQRRTLAVVDLPPSENFGFDPIARLLIGPHYAIDPGNNAVDFGVNVLDVEGGNHYALVDAAAPGAPFAEEPDSAAWDPGLHVAVIAEEKGPTHVVDFKDASFDDVAHTVTVSQTRFDIPAPPKGPGRLTGVAIDPSGHHAFLEQEVGSGVGILALDPKPPATRTLISASMPDFPKGTPWVNVGDPHGIAVTTGRAGKVPFGFLVNATQTYVARVDLQAFARGADALPKAVTFLDVRTPEDSTSQVRCGETGFVRVPATVTR